MFRKENASRKTYQQEMKMVERPALKEKEEKEDKKVPETSK